MDFDKYVNSLNELDNQENRTELESFYILHSAVLQYFNSINQSIQYLLSKPNVGTAAIKSLEDALPALTKLKREISTLDANNLHLTYKNKIDQIIGYVKNEMIIGEVNDTAQVFFDLLEKNNQAIIVEEQEKMRKEREEAERKAKAEQERKEREETNRIQRVIVEKELERLQQLQHKVCFRNETMFPIEIIIDNNPFVKINANDRSKKETFLQHGIHNIELKKTRGAIFLKDIEFNINVKKEMLISFLMKGSFRSQRFEYDIQ